VYDLEIVQLGDERDEVEALFAAVARSVELFDAAFKKHKDAIASGTSTLDDDGEEGIPTVRNKAATSAA
jgi:hypothetical protein